MLPAPRAIPPSELLVECSDIPDAASGELAVLMRNHIEAMTSYAECRARHKALADFVTNPLDGHAE